MSLDLTIVTGTVYDATGAPKQGVRVTIKRVVKDGAVISSVDRTSAPSDANGLISFTVPRNSTAWLKADIEGFTSSPNTGVPVSIPDAATANLEDLIPAISAPSTAVSQAALQAETAARIAGDAALADDIANIDLSGYVTTGALATEQAARIAADDALTTSLAGKSNTGHTHTAANITDFAAAADARISAWVGAAPAQLDTLNELATALNNDANFAATMTTALAGKMANTSGAIVSALGYTPYGSVSALTANRLARVTGAGVIADSLLSDDGTNVTLNSGQLLLPNGGGTAPSLRFGTNTGLYSNGTKVYFAAGGTYQGAFESAGLKVRGTGSFGFESGGSDTALDVILARDAANVLAQRNGTNAQIQRVYGSFVSATDYNRASFAASTTALTIAAESAGASGSANMNIVLTPKGTGGVVGKGNLRSQGYTSAATDPTTTELPADKDWSIHKNTASGSVFIAYNDGGTIKKAQLA